MANARALEQLRKEGFVAWEVDRRITRFLVRDLYSFGDLMGYDPLHKQRPRLVNACLEDVNLHIKKYLEGGFKDDGINRYPPNEHLIHLNNYWDCYIYSFVKRMEGTNRLHWVCRKWKYIVSPQGSGSFEKVENE